MPRNEIRAGTGRGLGQRRSAANTAGERGREFGALPNVSPEKLPSSLLIFGLRGKIMLGGKCEG